MKKRTRKVVLLRGAGFLIKKIDKKIDFLFKLY